MVPNTERLRSLIWDGYIKTCPPPLPEDDLHAIDQQLARLTSEIRPRHEKLTMLQNSILTDQQMMAVVNYTEYYNRCIQDAQKRPTLEAERQSLVAKQEELLASLEKAALSIKDVPPDFTTQLDRLKRDKERFRTYSLAKARSEECSTKLQSLGITMEEIQAGVSRAQQADAEARLAQATLGATLTSLTKEITDLGTLTGISKCPTCKQPITNVEEHLVALRASKIQCQEQYQEATRRLAVTEANLAGMYGLMENIRSTTAQLEAAQRQATESYVEFAESKLDEMLEEEKRINGVLVSMQQYENARVQTEAQIRVIDEQLKHLVTYSGNASPAEELGVMQQVLHNHRLRVSEINQLEKEIAERQAEIKVLDLRRATSQENHEKNRARLEYNNKLRIAYDVLHTSQFPRRLVQTYSSVVEEELQQQLQRFELPYQARINDDFRIIITKDGHPVPRLSGGQEMVVGLCLRLALHSMFSQAFPMLIIDEGTTHLDEENKKLYFQCINDLKTDKVIQQLIIIDHSALLTDAVDHVIRL
jgi:exonuclease SbcC